MGIEPTQSAWKAEVLPLNYTRLTLYSARLYTQNNLLLSHVRATLINNSARYQIILSALLSIDKHQYWRHIVYFFGFATQNWWRGKDSNLRRQSRQIYSLIPLTAREPLQKDRHFLSWYN